MHMHNLAVNVSPERPNRKLWYRWWVTSSDGRVLRTSLTSSRRSAWQQAIEAAHDTARTMKG